jgi:hypothetical protein
MSRVAYVPRRAVELPNVTWHALPGNNLVQKHAVSLLTAGPLLVFIGLLHAVNMHGWPARINDDEGTYVSQAWAVWYRYTLAHYTYWYDHPPFGWILMGLYAKLTDGFERTASALMVGREFMLIVDLVSCGLLYILARRLGMGRVFAAIVMMLFAVSPISLQYHRMVFLDNIAITWVLGAFALAVSPRRSLSATFGAAICMAGGMLTKETVAVLVPAMVWLVWQQQTTKQGKIWHLAVLSGATFLSGFSYILMALLKREVLQGPGHVSLQEALAWQLHGRPGSGSLLDIHSGTFSLARSWTEIDPWLLLLGAAMIPVGFVIRRLRPVAAALLIQILVMCKSGYMPYPYVIAMLPFAALLVGGTMDGGWSLWLRHPRRAFTRQKLLSRAGAGVLGLATVGLAFVLFAVPAWTRSARQAMTVDYSGAPAEATQWVVDHVDKHAVIIVDDYMWPDLTLRGYHNPVWFYKADLDPEIKNRVLAEGYRSIDYVVLGSLAKSTLKDLPTVATAIEQSKVMATFGDGTLVIRKVIK